ncbi:hypothetical protein PoB_006164700 [Plakobranchus ocellatus]|uniref:Reverse transcriptase domain-containing protein n=1 Tax=Plakobranchus ocellatus TaxID=259542 RepID=A0AAV4CTC3_9GAST|nr:hypothetical protein PoB_006164700 [Plakobranchus ocellatus]
MVALCTSAKARKTWQTCDYHIIISLFSIAGNILANKEPLQNHVAAIAKEVHLHRSSSDYRMSTRVQESALMCAIFQISKEMSQGCVLAPIFLGLIFSDMQTHVFRDFDTDINIRYKTDGSVMNLRRLQAVNQAFHRSYRRTSV